jgi:hypothetical protein
MGVAMRSRILRPWVAGDAGDAFGDLRWDHSTIPTERQRRYRDLSRSFSDCVPGSSDVLPKMVRW